MEVSSITPIETTERLEYGAITNIMYRALFPDNTNAHPYLISSTRSTRRMNGVGLHTISYQRYRLLVIIWSSANVSSSHLMAHTAPYDQ